MGVKQGHGVLDEDKKHKQTGVKQGHGVLDQDKKHNKRA
jgi:hypothetical protein